jgi:hypothetical protein
LICSNLELRTKHTKWSRASLSSLYFSFTKKWSYMLSLAKTECFGVIRVICFSLCKHSLLLLQLHFVANHLQLLHFVLTTANALLNILTGWFHSFCLFTIYQKFPLKHSKFKLAYLHYSWLLKQMLDNF